MVNGAEWLSGSSAAGYDSKRGARGDGDQLAEWMVNEQNDGGGDEGEQASNEVRGERARHAEDCLRDHCDCGELQSVSDTGAQFAGEERMALCESKHQESGGKGEGEPCRECSRHTRFEQADREAYLTAGRPGEGLAETYDFGEGGFVEPAEAQNELVTKIADVSDGTAEGDAAKAEEAEKDFDDGGVLSSPWHGRELQGVAAAGPTDAGVETDAVVVGLGISAMRMLLSRLRCLVTKALMT